MDRRTFVHTGAASLAAAWLPMPRARLLSPRERARPNASQLAWQREELAMFLHFGVNTFTNREWGDGKEDPAIFDPKELDARQWARTAKAAGFRMLIITAKHHDGFCLWPTETTRHSVVSSPFRSGKGDVVREVADACRAEGLRFGVYLSPWDRNNPTYGDSPRYNDLYAAQLTELLTRYGPVAEVWFDGANGEGPNGKRQVYDWPRVHALVRQLQPNAVMFSDAGPDVRWCGNERGVAGDPNWSPVDPTMVPYAGFDGPGTTAALQHGDPNGSVWRPAEADVSIRPGWFYHPAEDEKVRSVDNLVNLYFSSVGRNSKLLLNVPPTRDGLIHPVDAERLVAFRGKLTSMFETNAARGAAVTWRVTSPRGADMEVHLARDASISTVRLEENITLGQSVVRYALFGADTGAWRELTRGSTIGYAKLDRFAPTTVRKLKLVIEDALDVPEPIGLAAY
jgi:alpha-L-fucosidase